MDYTKISMQELRALSSEEKRTALADIKRELAELRMDVYSTAAVHTGKKRKLKKTLSRIHTVNSLQGAVKTSQGVVS